jgi:hypothetical protein
MPKPSDLRLKITEKQFQATVIQIAKWHGWMVFHPMPVQNTKGVWRTAVAGDIGFPDLVLAHSTRGVILAELKTGTGRLSDDQQLWIDTLLLAGAEAYVWRPKDLPDIQQRLRGR